MSFAVCEELNKHMWHKKVYEVTLWETAFLQRTWNLIKPAKVGGLAKGH